MSCQARTGLPRFECRCLSRKGGELSLVARACCVLLFWFGNIASSWPGEPIHAELIATLQPESFLGESSAVVVSGGRAYVANKSHGFTILDVSEPTNVRKLSNTKTRAPAYGVDLVGNVAYVAEGPDVQTAPGYSPTGVVQILDISNPANVRGLGAFKTKYIALGVDVVGNRAYVAEGVHHGGIFVGLLEIYDVSDSANVRWLGSYEPGVYPQDVQVIGNHAYLAAGNSGFQVLDISDPANVWRIGGFPTARDLGDIVGNFAYVADGHFRVLDISDPANVRQLGVYPYFFPGNPGDVQVEGTRAYVSGSGRLLVFDVSDPSNIRLLGGYNDVRVGDISVAGNVVYVANERGIELFDVADPSDVRPLWASTPPAFPEDLHITDHRAYVARNSAGLEVWDISDLGNVRLAGTFKTGAPVIAVRASGDRAYISDGTLHVLNVSDPSRIRRLGGTTGVTGLVRQVEVVRNRVYIANAVHGLQIFDVTDPVTPRLLGSAALERGARAFDILANRAYAGVMEIFDITDPANVRRLGEFENEGIATTVHVAGELACVIDLGGSLHLLNVSDPSTVRALSTYPAPVTDVHVIGESAYLTVGDNGFQILDVSQPERLRQVGALGGIGYARALQVIGDLVFVAGDDGLHVIRLSGGAGFQPGFLATPQNQAAPLGATVNLEVSAAGTSPLRYQWRKNGIDLVDGSRFTGTRTARLTIAELEAADLGSYSVVVSNLAGMARSAPAMLTLDPRFQVVVTKHGVTSGAGKVVLRVSGAAPGDTIILFSSTNLVDWAPMSTNVMTVEGVNTETPSNSTEPNRFFRARREQ